MSNCSLWPLNNVDLIPVIPYDKRVRQCPPPVDVVGGKVDYKDQFFDTDATYTADVDHIFENGGTSRTSICQIGGRWSATSSKMKRQ